MGKKVMAIVAAAIIGVASSSAQTTVVVHDPTKESKRSDLSALDQAAFDTAISAAKQHVSKDTCDPDIDVAGSATGSFSRARSIQTLVFYQYCQTGNGFGWAGLVLIEDGKVAGNFITEGGWTVGVEKVSDVNQNGLDEFTLAYSGGMHQGMGGTGVDLMEFSGGLPKGIGWYKAEEFGPTEAVTVWKLTARPGPNSVFYKQKYFSGENSAYRRVGKNTVTKLTKVTSNFSLIK